MSKELLFLQIARTALLKRAKQLHKVSFGSKEPWWRGKSARNHNAWVRETAQQSEILLNLFHVIVDIEQEIIDQKTKDIGETPKNP